MEIIFNRSPYKKKRVLVSAYTIGGVAGQVDYLNNIDRPHAEIGLLNVRERFQGLGIGRSLVAEVARDLGSGRQVRTVITHEPTLEYLEGMNPRTGAAVNLSYTFVEERIQDIPIVRVFESGGIHVLRIRVNYNSRTRRVATRTSVNGVSLVGSVV